jgi:hypothetical protein
MVEDIEYLRHAMDLVTYEVYGFGYIMARANNFLNHRRVVGFIVLKPDSGKRCTMYRAVRFKKHRYKLKDFVRCGNKAVVAVLFEYYDKKFRKYMCYDCFMKFLTNTVKYVEKKVRHVLDKFSILGLNSVVEVPDWFW